jgi:anthranilate synthase
MQHRIEYFTPAGVAVYRCCETLPYTPDWTQIAERIDACRGVYLASSYEYPGRYTRYDVAFVNPPIAVTGWGRLLSVRALNERGAVLLPAVHRALAKLPEACKVEADAEEVRLRVSEPTRHVPEEQRSRQPILFSALRAVIDAFRYGQDAHLGLYGAFGYDLVFQFEPIRLSLPRDPGQRDLVLFLPDEIFVTDHHRLVSQCLRYEFAYSARATHGLPRTGGRGRDGDTVRASFEWLGSRTR